MDLNLQDTIVALATPRRGGARGIVRISGDQTVSLLKRCFSGPTGWPSSTSPRSLTGNLQLSVPGSSVPSLLPGRLLLWPTRASFTREPTAEFHTLGSLPLLDAALATLCQAGARLARPGEFTLRAFMAGRIDLTQAEAVLGVIDAHDDRQLRTALEQLAGGLSRPLQQLREELLNLLADLEAGLDFVDEDIEFVSTDAALTQLSHALALVAKIAAQLQQREVVSEASSVVLYGRPNVGKSTLWNALTTGTRAIVSAQPGTTRDYLAAEIDLAGQRTLLIDTAGVETPDELDRIAQQAQQQTAHATARAALRILCLDATRPLDAWERAEVVRADELRLVVGTKADFPGELVAEVRQQAAVLLSAQAGQQLAEFVQLVGERLRGSEGSESAVVASTAARCRTSLREAEQWLTQAVELAQADAGHELLAASLRAALDELGTVVGAVYTDDLLDRIFSRFCIGK